MGLKPEEVIFPLPEAPEWEFSLPYPPKHRKPRQAPPDYIPMREWLELHKGTKIVLDCGHRAIIGDGRSNTIIIYPDGRAVCHECGY